MCFLLDVHDNSSRAPQVEHTLNTLRYAWRVRELRTQTDPGAGVHGATPPRASADERDPIQVRELGPRTLNFLRFQI